MRFCSIDFYSAILVIEYNDCIILITNSNYAILVVMYYDYAILIFDIPIIIINPFIT